MLKIECSKWHKDRMKMMQDNLIIRKDFKPRQKVLLYNLHLHLFLRKFKSHWSSPYIVHKVHPNWCSRGPQCHKWYHFSSEWSPFKIIPWVSDPKSRENPFGRSCLSWLISIPARDPLLYYSFLYFLSFSFFFSTRKKIDEIHSFSSSTFYPSPS